MKELAGKVGHVQDLCQTKECHLYCMELDRGELDVSMEKETQGPGGRGWWCAGGGEGVQQCPWPECAGLQSLTTYSSWMLGWCCASTCWSCSM